MLELYAFIFCQGGFRQLELTFEQFLLVAAAVKGDVWGRMGDYSFELGRKSLD